MGLSIPKKPHKEDVFNMFVLWRSLPPVLRQNFPDKEKTLEQMGFANTMMEELLGLPRQMDFAKKFKVHETTLSEWNRKIDTEGLVKNTIKIWAKKLTPNVISALYSKAMKHGDANRVKLWMQLFEDWVEETKVDTKLPFLVVKEED